MNPVATRRRPVFCPRCDTETESMRLEVVEKVTEHKTKAWAEEADILDDAMTIETEEWVKYLPCGHVVPPEEHEELVNMTTPPDVVR